jgi:hypothetical protein
MQPLRLVNPGVLDHVKDGHREHEEEAFASAYWPRGQAMQSNELLDPSTTEKVPRLHD